jgi:hypothetical protein
MSEQIEMETDVRTRAVLKVGDGRGFLVNRRGYLGLEERIVITAHIASLARS